MLIKIPFFLRQLKAGDVVVFRHPVYGTMIKRVVRLDPELGEIVVVGEHPLSTDSRQFGPIPMEALIGKVIWHIRKPG